MGFVVSSWLLYFYLPPGGIARVPAGWYGAITLAGYLVGVALAPWVAYLSDRARTPWGRRYPFMVVSTLPILASFVLLWLPPIPGQSFVNFISLLILLAVFKAATSFYQVPYQALLPDLALDDRLRVRLSAWQSVFLLLGFLLGGLAGALIERFGYIAMALVYAGIGLLAFLLPLLAGPERSHQATAGRYNFWRSLNGTLQNPAFLFFALAWALYLVSSFSVQTLSPFLVTEVCAMTESGTAYFYLAAVAASLACYPLVTRLADRLGKSKVYAGSLLASAVVFPGTMVIGPQLPIPLPAQCISWAALQAAAISGAVVLSMAFVAEIAADDRLETGQPREGMYFAVIKVFDQTLMGLASFGLPLFLLLGRSRLDPQGPLGVRLIGLASGGLMLLAFLCFSRYITFKNRHTNVHRNYEADPTI